MKTWVESVKGLSVKAKKTILSNLTMTREELGQFNVNELSKLLGIDLKDALKVVRHLAAGPNQEQD